MTITARSVAPRRSGPIFDVILAVAPILVAVVGVVMVYTATRGELLAAGESPHTYLKKQALFVVIGVIVMVAVALFDYRRLEPLATPIYIVTLLALLGVFAVGTRPRVRPAGTASGPCSSNRPSSPSSGSSSPSPPTAIGGPRRDWPGRTSSSS